MIELYDTFGQQIYRGSLERISYSVHDTLGRAVGKMCGAYKKDFAVGGYSAKWIEESKPKPKVGTALRRSK